MYYKKFRAECSMDVIRFFRALSESSFDNVIIKSDMDPDIPDVEVIFSSNQSLASLIQIANGLGDCHVIAQTIRPVQQYTGERNYEI